MTGYQRTLPRTKLLRQLRKHRARSAFRGEEERRERLLTELRKARLTGIRVTLPAETLDAKLASLPEGVSVSDRLSERVKSGHLWTPQIRPFRRPETGVEFYFTASCVCKVVWILVRQLRGPHFSTCA